MVELFGHNRIAGRISEQVIGGCSFVRVDVPAINGDQSYTKLFGQGAIYALTITDEETAKAYAGDCCQIPVSVFEARRLLCGPDDDANDLGF